MAPTPDRARSFLPLTAFDFQVLTVLADRELHGYAIIAAAKVAFPEQPELELGSLYRIISRMLDQRLLREASAPSDAPTDDRPRRYYRATALGCGVVRAEADRLRALLASPATQRLLRAAR
jgi:DNA-binding PadR family transcriptional regulator